jgi:Tol biopolymer transport system component
MGGKDYYPSISADGKKLYFTSCNRPGGFGEDDIWVSVWADTGWGSTVNLGPNINTQERDLSPSISSDGKKLYFVSWGRPGGYGSYDIWVSTWQDTGWGPAVNVGPNVNTQDMEWSVNISHDNRKLYFASDRDGSYGDIDIWVSQWDHRKGEWGPAENLGSNINTSNREYSPSISSDGKKLYFAKWSGGLGYVDIYVSEWQGNTWSPRVNLGSAVNTKTWDDGPSISSDGMKLYFASSRDTSNPAVQDIWVSERIPEGIKTENRKWKIETTPQLSCGPNPFSSFAVIRFSLGARQHVNLTVYDAAGRLVKTLAKGMMDGGVHEVLWDGTNQRGARVKSGIYFLTLSTESFQQTRKTLVVR